MQNPYNELKAKLVGKSGDEARQIKREFYSRVGNSIVDDVAWKDKARTKPTGGDAIASAVCEHLRSTFGDLYESSIGTEVPREIAVYYY